MYSSNLVHHTGATVPKDLFLDSFIHARTRNKTEKNDRRKINNTKRKQRSNIKINIQNQIHRAGVNAKEKAKCARCVTVNEKCII